MEVGRTIVVDHELLDARAGGVEFIEEQNFCGCDWGRNGNLTCVLIGAVDGVT